MPNQKRTFRSYSPAFNKDNSGARDRKRSSTVSLGTVTGNLTKDIFRAPSEVLIKTISLLSTVANAAGAQNFWKFDVQNVTKGGASIFTQTGQAIPDTSVNGISANTDFDIYADTSTGLTPGTSYFLTTNDVLQLVITKNSVPVNLQDLIVVIDYEISGVTTTTSTSTTSSTSTTTSTSTSTSSTTTTTISTTTTIT